MNTGQQALPSKRPLSPASKAMSDDEGEDRKRGIISVTPTAGDGDDCDNSLPVFVVSTPPVTFVQTKDSSAQRMHLSHLLCHGMDRMMRSLA
jgi:hypothetical protein